MGKRSWFSAVKKAMTPSCTKVKKAKRSQKSKSNPKITLHGHQTSLVTCSTQTEATLANPPYYYLRIEENEYENEQIKHVDSVTYTITTVEEVEDTASQATAEISCITMSPHFAAIKIQSAYRGYLARKDYRPLKARRRLRVLIQSQAVKRQTASTMKTMQTMARVQSQVRSRNIRMAEVNEALERQLHQRKEKQLQKKAFDLSPKSKEQVEAIIRSKKVAAERREKALAYAYSRQQTWKNSLKTTTITDPNYLDWSWSWSERWNVVKPWETGTTSNRRPVAAMGKRVSHQSPSTSLSKVMSATSKGSTKSMNVSPSPIRSAKKGPSNTGNGVGSTKKRNVSSANNKSMSAPRKISKTVR